MSWARLQKRAGARAPGIHPTRLHLQSGSIVRIKGGCRVQGDHGTAKSASPFEIVTVLRILAVIDTNIRFPRKSSGHWRQTNTCFDEVTIESNSPTTRATPRARRSFDKSLTPAPHQGVYFRPQRTGGDDAVPLPSPDLPSAAVRRAPKTRVVAFLYFTWPETRSKSIKV